MYVLRDLLHLHILRKGKIVLYKQLHTSRCLLRMYDELDSADPTK